MRPPREDGTARSRIVFVCHDAHPHGAQYLALHLISALRNLTCEVEVVLLGDGELRARYESLATVHFLGDVSPESPRARAVASKLATQGITSAICNTTASGAFAAILTEAGIDCIALIHELPGEIRRLHLQEEARLLAHCAAWLVFPSQTVIEGFARFASLDRDRCIVRPQGLYKHNRLGAAADRQAARRALRRAHGWPQEAPVVLAVGQASLRKGADLFVEAAALVCAERPEVRFLWVGDVHASIRGRIERRIDELALAGRAVFAGPTTDTDPAFAGADVFALPSREDPFPSVVLEAMQMGLPIVGFECAGGFVELLQSGCGRALPCYDISALSEAIMSLLDDESLRAQIGEAQRTRLEQDFCFRTYASDLHDLASGLQHHAQLARSLAV